MHVIFLCGEIYWVDKTIFSANLKQVSRAMVTEVTSVTCDLKHNRGLRGSLGIYFICKLQPDPVDITRNRRKPSASLRPIENWQAPVVMIHAAQ